MQTAGFDGYLPFASLRLTNPPPRDYSTLFQPSGIPAKSSFWTGNPCISYGVAAFGDVKAFASRDAVAELMIMAGRAGARFCSVRGIPAPYRGCAQPVVTAVPGKPKNTLENLLAKRDPETHRVDPFELAKTSISYSAGRVTLNPQPHWLMGFTDDVGYLKTTSPLRRFEDLLVHWQIRSAIARERGVETSAAIGLSEKELEDRILLAESATRDNKNAGKFADQWWQAKLLRARMRDPRPDGYDYDEAQFVDLNQPLEGYIAGQSNFLDDGTKSNTPLYIPSIGAHARLTGSKEEEIGKKVRVRISKILQWPKPLVDTVDA